MPRGGTKGNKGNTNNHKIGVPIFGMGSKEIKLPDESYGECVCKRIKCSDVNHRFRVCKVQTNLADGLCLTCWDF